MSVGTQKYKVVLFDADGLVLDSPRFSDRLAADHGITWEKMKPFFSGPFQECKLGRADLRLELEKVIDAWGWKDGVDALITYWLSGDHVRREVIELVHALRAEGIRCYVATNQETYRAEYLLDELGLGRIFDGVFVSADIRFTKDDPRFFEEAYKRLDAASRALPKAGALHALERSAILFTDHDTENLAAAAQAGFSTHHFNDLEALKRELRPSPT